MCWGIAQKLKFDLSVKQNMTIDLAILEGKFIKNVGPLTTATNQPVRYSLLTEGLLKV